jgi:hypothetical protein
VRAGGRASAPARFWRPVRAALLALPFAAATAWATRPELPFHPPQSEAERALDAILRRVDADPDPMASILAHRGRPTVDYTAMLTPPLIAAIGRAERELVRRNCGGRYREGEICGLDFVAVTCAQDSNESYLYHTGLARPDEAVIAYRWPGQGHGTAATYRLLRRDGAWRIDAIRCGGDLPSFNPAGFGRPGAPAQGRR